jgi:hypothetical protein
MDSQKADEPGEHYVVAGPTGVADLERNAINCWS